MAKAFDQIVADVFGFLTSEFGMSVAWSKQTDYGYDVLYVNAVCGVHIVYEFAEGYVFVSIHRLVDGKFIENPVVIRAGSVITGYSLDDILAVRAPEAVVKPVYHYGAESEYYDKNRGLTLFVSKFAENLRKHAADVLRGDFRIFGELEPVVRRRALGDF